jgi:hypothetical protein
MCTTKNEHTCNPRRTPLKTQLDHVLKKHLEWAIDRVDAVSVHSYEPHGTCIFADKFAGAFVGEAYLSRATTRLHTFMTTGQARGAGARGECGERQQRPPAALLLRAH